MKILLIDDDRKNVEFLRRGLAEHGFSTDVAFDGNEGLHLAREGDYDLIVLDVMLPGRDGWDVLRDLRQVKKTPVLFLTARDRTDERVKGLELGADDYLVKPFAFSELLARTRSVLRRGSFREPDTLCCADLELDLIRRKVHRAGVRIDLTAKEFSLLALFMQRQGAVLSRTLIAEQVWDMNFDSDTNVVDVAVRRLRAKMDDQFERKLVHTIRGMGYVLEDRA